MTITLSVTVTTPNDDNKQTENRVRAAVQRLYSDLRRSGADVSSISVGGLDGASFKPFKAADVKGQGEAPANDRILTGQPGAQDPLTMSIEAGTTDTANQPTPENPNPNKVAMQEAAAKNRDNERRAAEAQRGTTPAPTGRAPARQPGTVTARETTARAPAKKAPGDGGDSNTTNQ